MYGKILSFYVSLKRLYNQFRGAWLMAEGIEIVLYFNKKYEIVVTIKTIMTQIERLERNCFSLEFDCKKLGSTNINTPIM